VEDMENVRRVAERTSPAQRDVWDKTVPNWKKREAVEQVLRILRQNREKPFTNGDWDINMALRNKLTLLGMSHGLLDIIMEKIDEENLLEKYLRDPMEIFWKLREEYPDG